MDTHRLGRRFEGIALRWLVCRGWSVIDRNVRFGRKEIDLVVRRSNLVVFVEVKGRRGPECGHPLEAITPLKRHEIEAVARFWIARHGRPQWEFRFDAVAVTMGADGVSTVEHVEDAWRPRAR